MKKKIYIILTILIMIIASRFTIRTVDATVQIDKDITQLVLLLIAVNVLIVNVSRLIYRKIFK